MKWLHLKIQAHFYKKFANHFELEIKSCYYDHDNELSWERPEIKAYQLGLNTAIKIIKEAIK